MLKDIHFDEKRGKKKKEWSRGRAAKVKNSTIQQLVWKLKQHAAAPINETEFLFQLKKQKKLISLWRCPPTFLDRFVHWQMSMGYRPFFLLHWTECIMFSLISGLLASPMTSVLRPERRNILFPMVHTNMRMCVQVCMEDQHKHKLGVRNWCVWVYTIRVGVQMCFQSGMWRMGWQMPF